MSAYVVAYKVDGKVQKWVMLATPGMDNDLAILEANRRFSWRGGVALATRELADGELV